jgi:hypothetical protein
MMPNICEVICECASRLGGKCDDDCKMGRPKRLANLHNNQMNVDGESMLRPQYMVFTLMNGRLVSFKRSLRLN